MKIPTGHHARLLTVLGLLMLATAQPIASQTRRALVIGIGKQLDPAWRKINGDRDVALVTSMLRANRFSDIRTLVNSKATKAAIVSQMKALASRSKVGDIVYVHFSGHGQLMTDVNGDESNGWDEAWIPYDAGFAYGPKDRGEKHLSDDEIGILLSGIRRSIGRKGQLVVVVDACHSGDSTRGDLPEDELPERGVTDHFVIPVKKRGNDAQQPEHWITLSACKKYQNNQECPQGYGKLTYAISSMWQRMTKSDNDAVLRMTTNFMKRRDISGSIIQTPVMTGDKTNNHFSSIFKP